MTLPESNNLFMPPMPEFWLVFYKLNIGGQKLAEVKQSFSRLGFGIFDRSMDLPYFCFKVCHTRPKYMTAWCLSNSELMNDCQIKVISYIHNTRKNHLIYDNLHAIV